MSLAKCYVTFQNTDSEPSSFCSVAGRIALKLLEKSESSTICKSHVICVVNFVVLWASDPLQAIAKAHSVGHKAGMQSGDYLYSVLNEQLVFMVDIVSGQSLAAVRKQVRDFLLRMQKKNSRPVVGRSNSIICHLQAVVLGDGEYRLNEECVDDVPGLKEVVDNIRKLDPHVSLLIKIFHVQRALLFRQFDDISFGNNNISDIISKERHQLRPVLLMGIFYEGLVSFQLARRTSDETKTRWVEIGESALLKMTCRTTHCPWNFENKMLLLEAEKMYILGKFDQAKDLYTRSIQSAHNHKFKHEEAIASEIAGDLFYETQCIPRSLAFLKHSINCYKEWGAFAVARRVESDVRSKFGLNLAQLESTDNSLASVYVPQLSSSKKRPDI